jgi:hypothetical protein
MTRPAISIQPISVSRDLRSPQLQAHGAALEQAVADLRLEQEWRRRVRANSKEQARIRRWAAQGLL